MKLKEPLREVDLLLHNQRMLQVMRFVIGNNIMGIKNETQFLIKINNINKANNLPNIRRGTQSFTITDITKCCEVFGVDANYFLLRQHTIMLRPKAKYSAFEQLLASVQRIGLEMGSFTELEPSEAEKLAKTVKIVEAEEKSKKQKMEYN